MKDTADAVGELVAFFLPHCAERSTLSELKAMASDSNTWREAHRLFSRIRSKTLKADQTNDRRLQFQYSFEELCAKTLYNIADHSEGFSSASGVWGGGVAGVDQREPPENVELENWIPDDLW